MPGLGSVCDLDCQVEDCRSDQLCCSNGCGTVCTTPTLIPYYNIPLVCPSFRFGPLLQVCSRTAARCSEDNQCRDDQLCCRTECGRICQNATQSTTPCFTVAERIREGLVGSAPSLISNYFIPTCQADGTFTPLQCNHVTGLCWCVNINTGQPVSSYYSQGIHPTCSGEGPNPGVLRHSKNMYNCISHPRMESHNIGIVTFVLLLLYRAHMVLQFLTLFRVFFLE